MSGPLTLHDIYAARRRLRMRVLTTPLRESEWLSARSGARVLLKLESLQFTNSFKVRGALNALLQLANQKEPATIVTASAGNHGRAVAFAAAQLGLEAIVFTPSSAPDTKKAAIRRHGSELRDDAPDYDEAERRARAYAAETAGVFISPYNHRDVIAGAGTLALEVLDAVPTLDTIVVPLGGGGLASGVALAMKGAAPHVTVVGVEVEASTPFATGISQGAITDVVVRPSLADGLIGNLEPGSMTFDLVRQHVDSLVTVSENELRAAIRGLAEEEHVIAEGAGATATAAALARGILTRGGRAVVLVTGSNIDLPTFMDAVGERDR